MRAEVGFVWIIMSVVSIIAVGTAIAVGHIISNEIKTGLSDSSTDASNQSLDQLASALQLADPSMVILAAGLIISVLLVGFSIRG